MPDQMITPHPAETAPTNGLVIRGRFKGPGGPELLTVSWSKSLGEWVDLKGAPLPPGFRLEAWGER